MDPDRTDIARSAGRTAVWWDIAATQSLWATMEIEVCDNFLWPTKAATSSLPATESNESTTGADATRPSGMISSVASRLTLCPSNGSSPKPDHCG